LLDSTLPVFSLLNRLHAVRGPVTAIGFASAGPALSLPLSLAFLFYLSLDNKFVSFVLLGSGPLLSWGRAQNLGKLAQADIQEKK
jgi:hypothetical protein